MREYTMALGEDLAAAALIALVVLLVAAFAAPQRLDGYWATRGGASYEVQSGPGGPGGRPFSARAAGGTLTTGHAGWLRRVELAGRRGRLPLLGRRIVWDDGETWIRQGV